MQVPTTNLASRTLILLGKYHLAALVQTEDTRPLAESFRPAQEALVITTRAREDAELALIDVRVASDFAEWLLEQVLRGMSLGAHTLDNNNTTGPAFEALFPNTLQAEITPRGPAQLEAGRRVRDRLTTQPAAKDLRAEYEPKLDAALRELAARVEARKQARDALGLARAREDGARETWVAAYDANAGGLRTLFPRNRQRQNLYFDRFRSERTGDDDTDTVTPESPTAA